VEEKLGASRHSRDQRGRATTGYKH
jgi:hypothetical protein